MQVVFVKKSGKKIDKKRATIMVKFTKSLPVLSLVAAMLCETQEDQRYPCGRVGSIGASRSKCVFMT